METLAYFEKKVNLRPEDLNRIDGDTTVVMLLEQKLKNKLENKCSEHGFVVPNTVKLISHSVGYFEAARFTGDAVYYVKAEGMVLYPADGIVVDGEVIRKNKMGLYLNYRDGLRIQVPRDLNLTEELKEEFETVEIGDVVRVNLKKSLFQINDEYILTNGLFIKKVGGVEIAGDEAEAEAEVAGEEAEVAGEEAVEEAVVEGEVAEEAEEADEEEAEEAEAEEAEEAAEEAEAEEAEAEEEEENENETTE
jgi:DNA-directed RNA polymerase subunit E'/Rpb7